MMADRLRHVGLSAALRLVGIYKHLTLGARCAVFDEGKVLLVRHTYTPGWQFPGGGVDPGESAEQAMRRELVEETGYALAGPARFVGLYHNTTHTNRDHVAFFTASSAVLEREHRASREIAEVGWFAPDALPETVSDSVRRRLGEIAGGAPVASRW